MPATQYDVVVVGSGVAGMLSAYRLAVDHDVVVVDQGAIGGGTTSRASGVITTPEDYPDQPAWAAHAIDFFRNLDGTGIFEFVERPFVRAIPTAAVEQSRELATRDGVEFLDVDSATDRFPDVFTSLDGFEGLLVHHDVGLIDVDAFLSTVKREAAARGVEFRHDTPVESVRVEGGAVAGVETAWSSIDADTVVVAAGSGTPALLDDVVALPLRPFVWDVLVLDVGADLWPRFPMGGATGLDLYWRPTRAGHLLVGTEHPPENWDGDLFVTDEFKRRVRTDLAAHLAPLSEATIVQEENCPMHDSTTPDGRAIIDAPADGPDGLVVAAGFHGTGVMSAASVGTAVRSLVTGEDAPFALDPFSLDRFESRSLDFEFVSLFGR